MLKLVALFGSLFFYLAFSAENGDLVTVDTPRGSLTGFHADYGNDKTQLYYGHGDVFLGIPYAEPPLGEKRFQKPIPVCTYPEDPWDATYYRTTCPQLTNCSTSPQSEDCLYLNVFTPKAKSVYKYPVMVWIHGGSLVNGCAQQYHYKGAIRNLVSRGVVVVTLQYRLGVAGFFTTFTDDFPPNRGMLDQVEAIRWVSENIQYFGGNPYKITLFGESAGGISTSAHTYSPLSQNLFQQAIMQSGVVGIQFEGSLGFTNTSAQRAGQLCGFSYDKWISNDWAGLKECMLSKTADQFSALELGNINGWQIAQDSYFFPGTPQELAKFRPNIPVLIGSMRDEFSFFLLEQLRLGAITQAQLTKTLFEVLFRKYVNFYGDRSNDVMWITEKVYPPFGTTTTNNAAWFKISSDVFTAAGFTQLILREIDNYLANGNDQVYLYEQNYASKIGNPWNDNITSFLNYKPVFHTQELGFLWVQERLWIAATQLGNVVDFDYDLVNWYGEKWTNFAKFGVPTLIGDWKPVPAREVNDYYVIDRPQSGGFRMAKGYRFVDDITWLRTVPAIAGDRPPNKPDYNNGTNPLPTAPVPPIQTWPPENIQLIQCPNGGATTAAPEATTSRPCLYKIGNICIRLPVLAQEQGHESQE